MMNHLPVLLVIIPLLAAPLCLIIRQPRQIWLFSLISCGLTLLVGVLLHQQVLLEGPQTYHLGGWEAPIGIAYRIDLLNANLLLLISAIAMVILLFAHTSIRKEIAQQQQQWLYIAYLLCLAGSLGIVATADAFNVFVFLEIASLSSYILISLGKGRRALIASYRYLIMGTIGATFILISIGLLYMSTGTLNMQDLNQRIPTINDPHTLFTAMAFFVVGISLKLALLPLHGWLPNAYTYAPSIVSAFLSATATKIALYVLIRFLFSVFGIEFSFATLPLEQIFLLLGLLGIFVASFMAIYQTNLKRLFAYSSIAQVGYMVLGLGLATPAGLTASLLHLFNHALMKGALFLALGAIVYRIDSVELSQFQGLGKQMPWSMAAIVIGSLSLVGIPLTVGFVSKWYLVVALLEKNWWPVAILVLVGSLLALVYVWRIIETAYFKTAPHRSPPCREAPLSLLLPAWLLVAANIYFAIDTRLTLEVSQLAAIQLFGGGT